MSDESRMSVVMNHMAPGIWLPGRRKHGVSTVVCERRTISVAVTVCSETRSAYLLLHVPSPLPRAFRRDPNPLLHFRVPESPYHERS